MLKKYRKFPGFYDAHIPNAHLKSVFEEVWNKEFDICNSTSLHKFRNSEDITEWAMRYWQLASNKFVPINKDKLGCYASMKSKELEKAFKKKSDDLKYIESIEYYGIKDIIFNGK